MLTNLKATLARRPLTWFFVLVGAAYVAYVAFGLVVTRWSLNNARWAQELYQAGVIAAAVLITIAGRLWRRTEAAPPLPAPDELSPTGAGAGLEPTHVW